jgi:WD40 repeat protein
MKIGGNSISEIYNINFSFDSKFLICYSKSGTLHYFSVESFNPNQGVFSSYLKYQTSSYQFYNLKHLPTILKFDKNDSKIIYCLCCNGDFYKIILNEESDIEKFDYQFENIFIK